MMKVCLSLMMLLPALVNSGTPRRLPVWPRHHGYRAGEPGWGPRCPGQSPETEGAKIEASYDRSTDRTTVRLAPVQISAEKDKYHSLHMAPSFSFPGRQPARPAVIDFEVQTIVKAILLDSDLYVVFIIDGEKIHLSSNRWAIARPVPGRRWVGERLVFRMPYETFVKITKAKTFAIKFDGISFPVREEQRQGLRELALQIKDVRVP